MKIESGRMLESIFESLDKLEYIKAAEFPNIDLYMDQVLTFMNQKLEWSKRHDDDKIMTKTMINNYAKNHLLPAPEKKKYSKEHIIVLIFIYYYKGILSIGDIQKLLAPINEYFFANSDGMTVADIYEEVFSMEKKELDKVKGDVVEKFKVAEELFNDAPEEHQKFLKQFAFICALSYDVYVKRLLIEKMIEDMPEFDPTKK